MNFFSHRTSNQPSATSAPALGSAAQAQVTLYDFDAISALPDVDGVESRMDLQAAQHAFAASLNVGDLDVLDALLAEWEVRLATADGTLRLVDVATQMLWNYTAHDDFYAERGGANRSSITEFIETFERAVGMMPESPYLASVLANSYIEAAAQYKLVEKCAATSARRSTGALERAKQVLLAHAPKTTGSRMVASTWYRLQSAMTANCDSFCAAFERYVELDASDLTAYRQHGAAIVRQCGDDCERLQRSARYCFQVDHRQIGHAGYFILIANMLSLSNEPLSFLDIDLLEKGLADLLALSADPQFELNHTALLMAQMSRRISASRSIAPDLREIADQVRSLVCARLAEDLKVIRLDAWHRTREGALAGFERLQRGALSL